MSSKGKILVVDDTHAVLSLLKELLHAENYTVYTADSGELALFALEKIMPDLILLDIRMNGMSGFEVCQKIKEKPTLSGIPIIFLTAANEQDLRLEGLKLGAVDYITKPFNEAELIARVNTHVEFLRLSEKVSKQAIEIAENNMVITKNEELQKLFVELQASEHELKEANEKLQATTSDLLRSNAELKLAKGAIEENEEKFRLMYENTSVGIATADLDYRIINANRAFAEMLGYSQSELIGKKMQDYSHPEILDVNIQNLKDLQEGKIKHFQLEKKFIHKSGRIVYGLLNSTIIRNANNQPLYFLGSVQDITKRKMAEFELIHAKELIEESEEKHRFLFENMMQGVVYHNSAGEIIYANKAASTILGLSLDQLMGKTSYDPRWRAIHEDGSVFEGDSHPGVISLKTAKSVENVIMGVFNPIINEYTWIRINSIPKFKKNDTTLNSVVVIFEDITELRNAKLKSEESDRLKTAFLQNMSHEIRTPLNAICGFSGMLSKPTISIEKRNSFVSIIQNSSNQLLSIVSDILTISSLETNQEKLSLSNVCVNNVILDQLTIFKQQTANKNVALYAKHDLTDTESEIYTDKTKITQILTNLLSNAIKFTHEGTIEFGYRLKNEELEFFVKDSGIGISPELHQKIFERFRQADISIGQKYGGTGLGLAISKSFVELLGGRIWLESELGKGTIFYFTLPYNAESSGAKKNNRELTSNYKTILVAEDEEFNFLFIEELLTGLHVNVLHAINGKEAIEMCKSNSAIDLVLMDIKMPIIDGHTAAKEIRIMRPDLPMIAQSAYALEHEIEKYTEVFDDYVTKPIYAEVLMERIYRYIKL